MFYDLYINFVIVFNKLVLYEVFLMLVLVEKGCKNLKVGMVFFVFRVGVKDLD